MIWPRMTRRIARVLILSAAILPVQLAVRASPVVQETEAEFITSADLNGDTLQDVVLVDKATGRMRPGYQQTNGLFRWGDWRESGASGTTGLSVGRLLNADHDGLALSSRDGNTVTLLDASVPTSVSAPVEVPFALLGPAVVVAIDLGGEGETPLKDLFVGSVYNSPDENMASLFRNTDGDLAEFEERPLPGVPARADRIQLEDGGPELLALLLQTERDTALHVQSFVNAQPVEVAVVDGLEANARYTLCKIRGVPLRDLLVWNPGSRTIIHRPVLKSESGTYQFGPPRVLDLEEPIRSVVALADEDENRLFVIQEEGLAAGIYVFDSNGRPSRVEALRAPTNHVFTGALPARRGFVTFQGLRNGGSSVRYQFFEETDDGFREGVYGQLPTLADNDNLTLPGIHARMVDRAHAATGADMRPYTNSIPGTKVTYSMVAIPGGNSSWAVRGPRQAARRTKDRSTRSGCLHSGWAGAR